MARILHVPDALRRGPFSVAEAEACGIRRQRLRRPNFTRLARGVYLWAGLAREPEPKSESLMESRTRMLLILGGLPRPEVQVEIRDRDNMPSARLDFYFPAAKLGIEFDGDHHRARLVDDNRRHNALLVRFGIRLLRFTSSDVYRRPGAMVAQVRQALMPERPVRAKRTSAPKSALQAR